MRLAAKAIRRWRRSPRDLGMATLEYAVGLLAATAFAAVLLKLVTSDHVRGLLAGIVEQALRLGQ
jgi:hypothetical protein